MAYTPPGEGNFNVLYQLLAGADGQLKSDLLLNYPTGDLAEKNLYVEPFTNVCVGGVWCPWGLLGGVWCPWGLLGVV